MVAKIIVLAMCVVAALGTAAQHSAGVNPHACPNYPYCDNVALAAHATGAAHHALYAAPAYGHYAGAGVPGAAAAYPAGVDPHVCPNYPYCGPTPAHVPGAAAAHGAWAGAAAHNAWAAPAAQNSWVGVIAAHHAWAAPAGGHGAAHYPDGVNPHSCPNYPYCH